MMILAWEWYMYRIVLGGVTALWVYQSHQVTWPFPGKIQGEEKHHLFKNGINDMFAPSAESM
ncbi:hypothetical protein M378DRAFT_168142 [Amanita muscaria Koide BX008]|uniref:Uncharacterized protein n=1 Tax=Amanita muscaria (strain Koide BX008) TaxID=946122 RepID=A0A0C2WG31_AMAMK|nr:hypothetical protein M378DRAFT_168142 [Amanita muscaria Koide BX008]